MASVSAMIGGTIAAIIAASIGYYVAYNLLGTALFLNEGVGETIASRSPMFGIALFLIPVILVVAILGIVISLFGS